MRAAQGSAKGSARGQGPDEDLNSEDRTVVEKGEFQLKEKFEDEIKRQEEEFGEIIEKRSTSSAGPA
jgi:hypothetical protein